MADLLPALSGLNQLLLKKVELQKEEEKKKKGADLITEYDAKLRTAQSSKDLESANTWFLSQSQLRDVPHVQQTGYYMLQNFLPKFSKAEEKLEKQNELRQINSREIQGLLPTWENSKVFLNDKEITGAEYAKSILAKNPDATADDIQKQIDNLNIFESSKVVFDPGAKTFVIAKYKKNKAKGLLSTETVNVRYDGKKLWTDEQGEIVNDKGEKVTGTEGKFDAGIDKEVKREDILSIEDGDRAIQQAYQLDNPPLRGNNGYSGGYGNGRGNSKDSKESYFKGYTPNKSIEGLMSSLDKVYSNIKQAYISQIIKEVNNGDLDLKGETDTQRKKEIELEAIKRMEEDGKKGGGNSYVENINSQIAKLEGETDAGKAGRIFDISVGILQEDFAFRLHMPREQFKDYIFSSGKDSKGLLTLKVRFPNLKGQGDKWFIVDDPAVKNSIVAYYNGE